MKRFLKTEAIILKRSNLKDTDRIISIYSKDFGKLHVYAHGIRKITSKRAPHLELFNRVFLTLYKGHSFNTVIEVSIIDSYPKIKIDLSRIATAFIITELVDRLCPDRQENENIFSILQTTFSKLDDLTVSHKNLEYTIGRTLLVELGFISQEQAKDGFDALSFIENLIERRIYSKHFFESGAKLFRG